MEGILSTHHDLLFSRRYKISSSPHYGAKLLRFASRPKKGRKKEKKMYKFAGESWREISQEIGDAIKNCR